MFLFSFIFIPCISFSTYSWNSLNFLNSFIILIMWNALVLSNCSFSGLMIFKWIVLSAFILLFFWQLITVSNGLNSFSKYPLIYLIIRYSSAFCYCLIPNKFFLDRIAWTITIKIYEPIPPVYGLLSFLTLRYSFSKVHIFLIVGYD